MLPNIQGLPSVSYEELNKLVVEQDSFVAGRRGQMKDDAHQNIVFNKFLNLTAFFTRQEVVPVL